MYDARFGRWLSPDPFGQFASPYVGMGNAPNMGVDPDGGWFGFETVGQFIFENLPVIQSIAGGATLLSMTAVVVETTIGNTIADGLAKFGARMASGLKNTGNDLKEGFLRATDVVAGINKSLAGDLAPEYYDRSSESLARQETGEMIGTTFQMALSLQGIGRTGMPGTQLQPVRTSPGVSVTTQVTTPTIAVTDVHGRVLAKGERGRGANRTDRQQVDSVAKKLGIKDRRGFGDYIEKVKKLEGRGGAANYTFEELLEIGKEFLQFGGY